MEIKIRKVQENSLAKFKSREIDLVGQSYEKSLQKCLVGICMPHGQISRLYDKTCMHADRPHPFTPNRPLFNQATITLPLQQIATQQLPAMHDRPLSRLMTMFPCMRSDGSHFASLFIFKPFILFIFSHFSSTIRKEELPKER